MLTVEQNTICAASIFQYIRIGARRLHITAHQPQSIHPPTSHSFTHIQRATHSREQRAAESREQRAESSKKQRAESREQRAESREQSTAQGRAAECRGGWWQVVTYGAARRMIAKCMRLTISAIEGLSNDTCRLSTHHTTNE